MTAPIPLFTSVPPKTIRRDAQGRDIGQEYQSNCIGSWRANGFAPISLNAASETLSPKISALLERRDILRNASDTYGKPVLYLDDVLREIGKSKSGIVAITNADIMFDFTDEERALIANLCKDECVVLNRVDVEDQAARSGKRHIYGYDFWAFHASALQGILTGPLALGIPWWDHFLPLWLKFSGLRRVPMRNAIFHLDHADRWSPEHWMAIGAEFEALLQHSLPQARLGDPELQSYLTAANTIRRLRRFSRTRRVKITILDMIAPQKQRRMKLALTDLSHLNNREIDNWS